MPQSQLQPADTISIVMPVRNGMPFIKECLNSIIAQSWESWELIVINDHSTDSTPLTLTEFALKDNRIQWYDNDGRGITPALIQASSYCSGTMITRMDADDLMPSNKLEKLQAMLHQIGHGYVITGMVEYFSEEELGQGYLKYADWLNNLTKQQNHYSEIYKECSVASANWLMYLTDFEMCGGFAVPMYPEDYALVFEWRKNGMKVIAVPSITHQWRDHPDRTSRNDVNYMDNSFTHLKVTYFLDQDRDNQKELVLWGAGPKGKLIAKKLTEKGISFRWICNNDNKIGKAIYGIMMESIAILQDLPVCQIIVGVSQRGAVESIQQSLIQLPHKAFYFC